MKKSETKKFRTNILQAVEGSPGITAKELAIQMDVQQSNLYYHLKNLMKEEKVSIIIRTTVNGINEKYYYPYQLSEKTVSDETEPEIIIPDVKIQSEEISGTNRGDGTISTAKTLESEDPDVIIPLEESLTPEIAEVEPEEIKIEDEFQNQTVPETKNQENLDIKEETSDPDDPITKESEDEIHTSDDQQSPSSSDADSGGLSLKNILLGNKPDNDDQIMSESEAVIEDSSTVEQSSDEEDLFDEVIIEDIPFLIPKNSRSLDELLEKTKTKGDRIIDLQIQSKVFEYLKSNYTFRLPKKESAEKILDAVSDNAIKEEEIEDRSGESESISNVKISTNPFRNAVSKLSFNSYELAIQQAGKSLNILFTQKVGDNLKLIYNEKLTIPLHEHMNVLGDKIDYILEKFNIKRTRVKVSVESDQIFTQKMEFDAPDIKKKEIEELIKVKIQRELKIDPQNSYFNFNVKKSGEITKVVAQIGDADPINEFIEYFKTKDLNIAYVSSLGTVCSQLFEKTYGKSSQPVLLIYLGYSRSNLIFIQNGEIVMNTRIGASISDLIKKMKGSFHGSNNGNNIHEKDILELIESDNILDKNKPIVNRLNIHFNTVKQLIEEFIKTIRNDMVLSIRQFQRVHSINITEGFMISYLDKSDGVIKLLSEDIKFDLKEIEIEKYFNEKYHSEIRDYFAILIGLSVANKREQNLLPKTIREKAVYIGRTKVLAAVSSITVGVLAGLLIFNYTTFKNSDDIFSTSQNKYDNKKTLYLNSVNFQKRAAKLDFIEKDLMNKKTATKNISRFLTYLGNELPSGIKLNSLKTIPRDPEEVSEKSVYPYQFEIRGFVTSDLSNALIILEGMKDNLEESNDINLISFENTDFIQDKTLNLPKQYFTLKCELK